jgi:hypothetical protein
MAVGASEAARPETRAGWQGKARKMTEVQIDIPPEYLPYIEVLFNGTVVVTTIWLLLVAFILLRRNASNLTPIQAAKVNKNIKPAFLNVDHEKQEDMKNQGAAYDAELKRREAEEAREKTEKDEPKRPETIFARIARVLSVIMSVFTLATMIGGVIFNVNYLGGLLREYSATDRFRAIVERYPIAVTVAALVIIYHIYTYIAGRKWKTA